MALAALVFASGLRATGDAPAPGSLPAARMAPVRVQDSSLFFGYTLDVHWELATGMIDYIEITGVERGSLAEKAGLKAGDHLLAVDGKPATGITQPEFVALMTRDFTGGQTIFYRFTIGRGFFLRRMELVLRIRG
jgi:membrane-associated protease RseP (regulator of RpoE activity)